MNLKRIAEELKQHAKICLDMAREQQDDIDQLTRDAADYLLSAAILEERMNEHGR